MKPANISKQRIMGEARKLKQENLAYLRAQPLPDDIYTWHFTIQGPEGTQFHQGIYHGQILLPYQYPFKPPDIVFMNKNGRFETNTKICLTITQYHPEEWNSAWTIRTMLEAVISLFSENIQGVGALTSSSDVRTFLALNSHSFHCQKCGPIAKHLPPRPKGEPSSEVPVSIDRSASHEPSAPKIEKRDEQVPVVMNRLQSQRVNPFFKQRQKPATFDARQFSTETNNPSRIRSVAEQPVEDGVQRTLIRQCNPYGDSWVNFKQIIKKSTLELRQLERILVKCKM